MSVEMARFGWIWSAAFSALLLFAAACVGPRDELPEDDLFSPLRLGDTSEQVRARFALISGASCRGEKCDSYQIYEGSTPLTVIPVFDDDRLTAIVAVAGYWSRAENSASLLDSWSALVSKATAVYGKPSEVRDLPDLSSISSTVVTHRWITSWGGVELGFPTQVESQRELLPVLVASPGIK